MAKSYRGLIGNRRYTADFYSHNGNVDTTGTPTWDVSADWNVPVLTWPCELTTTRGTEDERGKQVTATTTHVLYGEYFGAKGVAADMKIIIGNDDDIITLAMVSAVDTDGTKREMRIEAKREQ